MPLCFGKTARFPAMRIRRQRRWKRTASQMAARFPASNSTAQVRAFSRHLSQPRSDTGKALEVLVAEHTGRVTLVSVIATAVQKLKASRDLAKSGLSVEETLAKVLESNDGIIIEFAAALQQAAAQGTEAA